MSNMFFFFGIFRNFWFRWNFYLTWSFFNWRFRCGSTRFFFLLSFKFFLFLLFSFFYTFATIWTIFCKMPSNFAYFALFCLFFLAVTYPMAKLHAIKALWCCYHLAIFLIMSFLLAQITYTCIIFKIWS